MTRIKNFDLINLRQLRFIGYYMTRREAMTLLGLKKLFQLADKLELTTSAIAQWGDDEDIPEYREYEVRELAAGRIPKRLRKSKQNLTDPAVEQNIQN